MPETSLGYLTEAWPARCRPQWLQRQNFSAGAAAPLALVPFSPSDWLVPLVFAGSLLFLAALGIIGARVGGAGILRPTIRVTFALAMAVTAGIGAALGRGL